MTYDLIQEQVLGSAAASVTFSNIPGTFKDLVLEVIARQDTTTVLRSLAARANGDSANNYSLTFLVGDGSSAFSGRVSNITQYGLGDIAHSTQSPSFHTIHFPSYSNTNVFKTALTRAGGAQFNTIAVVALWRSTSAITSLQLFTDGNISFAAGGIFRLWGVVG